MRRICYFLICPLTRRRRDSSCGRHGRGRRPRSAPVGLTVRPSNFELRCSAPQGQLTKTYGRGLHLRAASVAWSHRPREEIRSAAMNLEPVQFGELVRFVRHFFQLAAFQLLDILIQMLFTSSISFNCNNALRVAEKVLVKRAGEL